MELAFKALGDTHIEAIFPIMRDFEVELLTSFLCIRSYYLGKLLTIQSLENSFADGWRMREMACRGSDVLRAGNSSVVKVTVSWRIICNSSATRFSQHNMRCRNEHFGTISILQLKAKVVYSLAATFAAAILEEVLANMPSRLVAVGLFLELGAGPCKSLVGICLPKGLVMLVGASTFALSLAHTVDVVPAYLGRCRGRGGGGGKHSCVQPRER